MDYRERLRQWMEDPAIDEKEKEELKGLDEKELEDRFYRDLEFGTAGLRGHLGAGTNRMNEVIIKRASCALGKVVARGGKEAKERGVMIAYDVRRMSREFAHITARVLAAMGIRALVTEDIRPTPLLAFGVRHYHTKAGVMVTASHNPKNDNGYKVYWEEGSQILEDKANEILAALEETPVGEVTLADWDEAVEKGLIRLVGKELDDAYDAVTLPKALTDDVDFSTPIVYTPLHGTGNIPVRRILKARGFENIIVVKEQENPDGTFPTIDYPNPEDSRAFACALPYAKEHHADLILATDPDSDRLAAMIPTPEGEWLPLNGNQMGAMLIAYILERLKEQDAIPGDGAVVKSVVTGDFGRVIAESYGVATFETLTGFKNICDLPNQWDKNHEQTFIFGYEESIGYVYGDQVRDKDAVISAMIFAEMCAFEKKQGRSLYAFLEDLYTTYGYYREKLVSLVREGIEGKAEIEGWMRSVREEPMVRVADMEVVEVLDYKDGVLGLPKTNLLKYRLLDGSWFALRPSGTEPKLKLYVYAVDPDRARAEEKVEAITKAILSRLEGKDR